MSKRVSVGISIYLSHDDIFLFSPSEKKTLLFSLHDVAIVSMTPDLANSFNCPWKTKECVLLQEGIFVNTSLVNKGTCPNSIYKFC